MVGPLNKVDAHGPWPTCNSNSGKLFANFATQRGNPGLRILLLGRVGRYLGIFLAADFFVSRAAEMVVTGA